MQQINLYLPELRPSQEWLTASSLGIVLVGFVFLLALAAFLQGKSNTDLEKKIVALENQQVVAKQRLDKFKSGAGKINSLQLDRRLQAARTKLEARKRIGQVIEGQSFGNQSGFSDLYLALAENSQAEIQLESFKFSDGGMIAELAGLTRNPKSVPVYLSSLRESKSFTSTQFGVLSLREINNSKNHRFALGYSNLFASESFSAGAGQ